MCKGDASTDLDAARHIVISIIISFKRNFDVIMNIYAIIVPCNSHINVLLRSIPKKLVLHNRDALFL